MIVAASTCHLPLILWFLFRAHTGVDTPAKEDMNIEGLWKAIMSEHVLLLRGKDSDILPVRGVELMKKTRPDLEVVEFEEVGHAPTLMVEDQIAIVLNWLDKISAASA